MLQRIPELKVTLLHPGTQHSHHLARELTRLKMLDKFITSFVVSENSILNKLFHGLLTNRVLLGISYDCFKTYPDIEFSYWIEAILNRDQEYLLYKRNSRFQDRIIKNDLKDKPVIIGFDTSSWKLAEHCQKTGQEFILDVSIGHPLSKEKVFEKLRTDFPLWKDGIPRKNEGLVALEQMELQSASKIVVPSNFVKRTLIENNISPNKIFVNPFGTSLFTPYIEARKTDKKLIFLFFGSLTARKGLPTLLNAWKALGEEEAELIIAGYGNIPKNVSIPENVKILGAILPEKRAQLYAQADVFVFPSFFEGFAQVQVEAAACGLPIIGTQNSGAEEIIQDGYNGFIVEPGNIDQLVSAMRFFVKNREKLAVMSAKVRERIDFFSWNSYGNRWKAILETKLS